MSQEQPWKPQPQQEPIKCGVGDVFDVSSSLAGQPVAPPEVTTIQSAENGLLGLMQSGGAAAVVQSTTTRNERDGVVGLNNLTNVVDDRSVGITKNDFPGKRVIIECISGQVVQQPSELGPLAPTSAFERGNITIGEALEASALVSGERPVDYSDAAAIQAAEVRAIGSTYTVPGGVAAAAQSAATRNARIDRDEEKTKLREVLSDATTRLRSDRPVTRRDAEGVIAAELRNDPNLATRPGGVAASVAAAARLNQSNRNLATEN